MVLKSMGKIQLVRRGNLHSTMAYSFVLQTQFAPFSFPDEITSFCMRAMVLGIFQRRGAHVFR